MPGTRENLIGWAWIIAAMLGLGGVFLVVGLLAQRYPSKKPVSVTICEVRYFPSTHPLTGDRIEIISCEQVPGPAYPVQAVPTEREEVVTLEGASR